MADRQQQSAYLQAMGIQAWSLRDAVPEISQGGAPVEESVKPQVVPAEGQSAAPVPEPPSAHSGGAAAARAALAGKTRGSQTRTSSAQPVNVPATKPQTDKPSASSPSASKAPFSEPALSAPPMMDEEPPMLTDDHMPELEMADVDLSEMGTPAAPKIDVRSLDWPALQTAVADCRACELHQSRSQTVFGSGAKTAQWMIIGEAPDGDEETAAAPFKGPAGQLLDNMLRALGLRREQVFLSNVVKCRPPEDRHPQPTEFASCEAYLQRQIALVQPKLILAMGAVAAHSLLKVDAAVGKLRGEKHHYANTPLVVTYHPDYLLHKPSEKAKSWADLQFAASVLAGDAAGEQGGDA